MNYNYYILEMIGRDIQSDRESEAMRERRWVLARKAMRKLTSAGKASV